MQANPPRMIGIIFFSYFFFQFFNMDWMHGRILVMYPSKHEPSLIIGFFPFFYPSKCYCWERLAWSSEYFGFCLNSILYVVFTVFFWNFVAANEPKDADIIWTSLQVDDEMKKATGITDQQYVNQFPFEACLVMKHHLADTVQKVK